MHKEAFKKAARRLQAGGKEATRRPTGTKKRVNFNGRMRIFG